MTHKQERRDELYGEPSRVNWAVPNDEIIELQNWTSSS